jgi:multidrug efflux system membrane fusion protein
VFSIPSGRILKDLLVNLTFIKSNRAKTWAGLVCLAMATLATQGCTKATTASADAPGGGPPAGGGKGGGRRGEGGGAVPVLVAKVAIRDVPIELSVVGNVEAYSTITVKAQVGGQLTNVYFNEGDYVKAGDQLFTIDPRPLEAQLAQSEANLARDRALLSQAEANLARDTAQQEYAQSQAVNYSKLSDQGIISKEQANQLRTNANALAQSVLADKAAIESSKAQITADQASIGNAKVQLSYTSIRSPIDGRTGNLMVKQGNIVAANSTDLITINQIEPIYVTFSVPEARLAEIKRYMAGGKLQVAAKTQEGDAKLETGELTFVDNNVDMTTGTIKLKGTFRNKEHKLWPGQYLNVTLRLTVKQNAVVVPNQAVQSGQNGQFVYVVKQDRSVEARPVTTGTRVEQDLVVDKGLEDGETVVTEGQLRLAPGSKVQMRDGRDKQSPGRGKAG